MEILKRRSAAARRLALVALAAGALSTSTCSLDWWFGSFGPAWFSLARAGFDVAGTMADELEASKTDVIKVERYVQAGEERVFVVVESDQGRAMIVLHGSTLERLAFFPPSVGPFNDLMFQDATGQVIVGQVRIDSVLNAYNDVALTFYSPETRPLYGYGFHDGTNYKILEPQGNQVGLYESGSLLTTPGTPSSILFTSAIDPGSIIDIEAYTSAGVSGWLLNVVIWNTIERPGHVYFTPMMPPSDPINSITDIKADYWPPEEDRATWLTSDGLILMVETDGRRSFERRAFDGLGTKLDSFPLGDTEDQRFFFDPDGEHWYVWDRWHGRLHLLATWWSE